MKIFKAFSLLLAATLLSSLVGTPVKAQQSDPPVYIVQGGDSIISIASQFGISPDELVQANALEDPNNLVIGDQLTIPGLDGVHGVLATTAVGFGETLASLARRYQVPQDLLVQLNHITSPSELYVGTNIIIPQPEQTGLTTGVTSLSPAQSLLELAAAHGTDPNIVATVNSLAGSWEGIPGDPLFFPAGGETTASGAVFEGISAVDITPLPLVQGKTTVIKVAAPKDVSLTGSILGQTLHFFELDQQTWVALQGIHALTDPGIYPLSIEVGKSDGTRTTLQQMVRVKSGFYAEDPHLTVDPTTIDPKVTGPETDQIAAVVAPINPERYWQGLFQSPGYDPNWITSWFGNRRKYNDDPTTYFHGGLDYGGGTGLPIHAPADGVVVFTGQLTVRGNATIIDHGWGVYSGFWHQSEIQVKVGDRVKQGQQIGLVGGTGRVTGAHLHWEVIVNGIQVDPLDWLDTVYP